MISLLHAERASGDVYRVTLNVYGEAQSYEWEVIDTDINGLPVTIISPMREAILDFDEYIDEWGNGGCFVFRCVHDVLWRMAEGEPVDLPMVIDPEDWTIEKWRARRRRDPGP